MTIIPEHMEDDVLARYRAGESVESIHRALWPAGNPSVSGATLRAILEGMRDAARAQDDPPPDDALPEDLGDLIADLRTARAAVIAALAGVDVDDQPLPTEDGGPRPGPSPALVVAALSKAVSDNVKAAIAVSKHRAELQKHRDWLAGGWRSGLRR